jgi:cytochrome oxidase Cu insertion factor (SCO1/SenC/PrrC family)
MRVFYSTLILAFVLSVAAIADEGSLAPRDLKKLKIISFVPPEKAPEFSLQNLKGETVKLSSYRGKPLMLYFWATW